MSREMPATQQCPECGSPLTPCKCDKPKKPRTRLRRRPFAETRTDDRYGPTFEAVRRLPCMLAVLRYDGPKHESCGPGVQGGHTAHHVGKLDREGLLPGCGLAHDLYAGIAGRRPQLAFDGWLKEHGLDLAAIAFGIADSMTLRDLPVGILVTKDMPD